ncbi:MAG TPA: fibrillarin-like rRNA/tRNA 2'-O-methyltransferase [archaeon]|nr:fibrillarin-like rRNA/tRNA 2'-O-methyltransferase [archaeon]HLD81530.1 fibrillarin-like rRNA/tRNA 2'-O-methyltransferase [archaeon]
MALKEVFPGVYRDGRVLFTVNAPQAKGKGVYGEHIRKVSTTEFRAWEPNRSKLGAAIMKGLKELPIKPGSRVLYLGVAEGTTASHVSDIVGSKGIVFGVDVAPKVMRKLMEVCEVRTNLLPLLADANHPESYKNYTDGIKFNCIFQDIAQENQTEILVKNAQAFLEKGGRALYAVKSQCIDSTRPPREVFAEVKRDLEKYFDVLEEVNLEPFESGHVLFSLRKK